LIDESHGGKPQLTFYSEVMLFGTTEIRKKFKWSNGDMRGRVKGSNTLDFVQMIDEKWNESEHVEGSTIKEFSFPDWYIKGKISYNREFPSD